MKKHLLLILSLALLAGCAARPNLGDTEAAPTYGTKAVGDRFTAANHNELYNSAVAAAADITTLQGYWAIVHAITGIVECDGAGTCAAADNILITGPAGAVGDEVVSVTSDTSRDLAEFRGNVAAEDINIRVTSNAADSSSGYWMSLVGQNKGGGISTGTVGGTTELAIGVGAAPTNNFWEVMTGTKVKHVMAEDAPSLYQRATGFGFGVEPSEFFHIEENSSRTNSVGNVLRVDAVTDQDMVDGFGAQALFYVEDTAAVSNPIAAIAAVRSGADNSGALVLKTYNSGAAGDALELGANKTATFYGTIIHPAPVTTGTVTDSGDGNPANGTVTVAANTIPQSVVIDCQDADGCPMTMSEEGAVNGMRARVFSAAASAGDMSFITSAGVQAVRSTRTLEPGESVEFEYTTDYWDEISDSTEPGVSAPGVDGDFVVNSTGAFGALTIATLSQADAEDDTDTTYGFITGERLGQAITAWMAAYRGTEDSPRTSEPAQADLYIGLTVWADGDQWQPAGVTGVHEVQCIELGNPATWIALRSAGGDVYLDVPRYVKASSTLNDTTTPHALTDGEMLNHTISNYGDSAAQTYSVPVYSTAVGWDVEWFMGAAYDMIIAPSGSSSWYLDGVARTAGQYITNASPAVGESVACKDKYGIIWCTSTGTGWAWATGVSCDLDSDAQVFAFATLDSNQTIVDAAGNWRGEAFTLAGAQDLTGFQIYAVDLSSDTGTITCELKAYDFINDEPTGSVLATTGALASSTMPNTSQQFFFPFTAVYSASASDYCVYCYGSSGGTIGVRRVAAGTEDVANAQYIFSYDTGATWDFANYDLRGDGVFGCAP